eukprot:TRINITY_DN3777_c1_g1_i1.p1 TRINITY_DN3777_c1_g1~~TRINITY_DN3777_c1_g1_i1.p1  ORF type:complete len:286 (-),score=83.85 TRINITY_DN3777_c1_g1_i1:74-931(-)
MPKKKKKKKKKLTRLPGRVAIVTGSGQGIGAATARLFAAHGAHVVVSDLDAAKAQEVVRSILALGQSACNVSGDITDPSFPAHLIESTVREFGDIHVIVNNAGYCWDGMLHKITDEQWDAMIAVHNTAPFRIIRAAAAVMREKAKAEIKEHGAAVPRSIINISSTSGLHGNVGQANYATAKMGILGLTKTVAKEWGGFGIRCNALAFGMVKTRLTQEKEKGASIQVNGKSIALGIPAKLGGSFAHIPLGRAAETSEAAGAVLALASDLTSYVTGHCLEMTGGAGI